MSPTLFISDLHLSHERPALAALFLNFLHGRAPQAEALYILGDLFEVWLGDDAIHPAYQPILAALRALADSGVPVYVMHGNREFLLATGIERASGCRLIADPALIELNSERTLIMQGDVLSTDDLEYQQFRAHVRNPETQHIAIHEQGTIAVQLEQRRIDKQ